MRLRSFLLFLVLAATVGVSTTLVTAPTVLAQQRPDVYTVQAGDTLFRIASAQGMTVAALKELNQLESDLIVVGQRLRLTTLVPIPPRPVVNPDGTPLVASVIAGNPNPEAPADPSGQAPVLVGPQPGDAPGRTHVVQPGETLFRIALQYDTSVDVLRRLNGITGDGIAIGQRLTIRGDGRPAAPTTIAPPSRRWRIDATTVPADQVHFVEPGETVYSIASALGVSSAELLAINDVPSGILAPGTMLVLPRPIDPRLAIEPNPIADADTVGLALVYPQVMVGRRMASGAPYDPAALTASHRTLPFGTVILVTNPASGRSTFVRVMDRGPVSQSYLMELSAAAAQVLDLDPNAARRVELRRLP